MSEIPKIIHYCWFGEKKPKNVEEFILNWKSILPEYVFIEWNESNFDINICMYVKEAYDLKKYAFVSDYARLYALYNYGGIYLDTDVELKKTFNDILNKSDVILGFEEFDYVATSTILAKKESNVIKIFMEKYHEFRFVKSDSSVDTLTNVYRITEFLTDIGLIKNGESQQLEYSKEKVVIFPQEYFSPLDYANRIDNSGANTYAIHHYEHSWGSNTLRRKFKSIVINLIGGKRLKKIRMFLKGY